MDMYYFIFHKNISQAPISTIPIYSAMDLPPFAKTCPNVAQQQIAVPEPSMHFICRTQDNAKIHTGAELDSARLPNGLNQLNKNCFIWLSRLFHMARGGVHVSGVHAGDDVAVL